MSLSVPRTSTSSSIRTNVKQKQQQQQQHTKDKTNTAASASASTSASAASSAGGGGGSGRIAAMIAGNNGQKFPDRYNAVQLGVSSASSFLKNCRHVPEFELFLLLRLQHVLAIADDPCMLYNYNSGRYNEAKPGTLAVKIYNLLKKVRDEQLIPDFVAPMFWYTAYRRWHMVFYGTEPDCWALLSEEADSSKKKKTKKKKGTIISVETLFGYLQESVKEFQKSFLLQRRALCADYPHLRRYIEDPTAEATTTTTTSDALEGELLVKLKRSKTASKSSKSSSSSSISSNTTTSSSNSSSISSHGGCYTNLRASNKSRRILPASFFSDDDDNDSDDDEYDQTYLPSSGDEEREEEEDQEEEEELDRDDIVMLDSSSSSNPSVVGSTLQMQTSNNNSNSSSSSPSADIARMLESMSSVGNSHPMQSIFSNLSRASVSLFLPMPTDFDFYWVMYHDRIARSLRKQKSYNLDKKRIQEHYSVLGREQFHKSSSQRQAVSLKTPPYFLCTVHPTSLVVNATQQFNFYDLAAHNCNLLIVKERFTDSVKLEIPVPQSVLEIFINNKHVKLDRMSIMYPTQIDLDPYFDQSDAEQDYELSQLRESISSMLDDAQSLSALPVATIRDLRETLDAVCKRLDAKRYAIIRVHIAVHMSSSDAYLEPFRELRSSSNRSYSVFGKRPASVAATGATGSRGSAVSYSSIFDTMFDIVSPTLPQGYMQQQQQHRRPTPSSSSSSVRNLFFRVMYGKISLARRQDLTLEERYAALPFRSLKEHRRFLRRETLCDDVDYDSEEDDDVILMDAPPAKKQKVCVVGEEKKEEQHESEEEEEEDDEDEQNNNSDNDSHRPTCPFTAMPVEFPVFSSSCKHIPIVFGFEAFLEISKNPKNQKCPTCTEPVMLEHLYRTEV